MRHLVVLAAACVVLSACSTRALHAREDLWEGAAGADGAAFLGDHGRVERPATASSD
jgi:hypothetical protein